MLLDNDGGVSIQAGQKLAARVRDVDFDADRPRLGIDAQEIRETFPSTVLPFIS